MRILASPAYANEKVNPYNALLYKHIAAIEDEDINIHEYSHKQALLKKFDIIHFHWPDGYINQRSLLKALQRSATLALMIIINQWKGSKIVWTVHNVAPHDAHHPVWAQRFMRWFVRRCNGLIFMSEESRRIFLNEYHDCQSIAFAIIPHGHYRNSYAAPIPKDDAKKQLNLPADKKVLLFCGMIKPYKNIDALIKLFISANLDDYVLVIAGNPDSSQLRNELAQHQHPQLKLFLQFIPDNQLHFYLSAADTVILPYKAILNSGALLLALSFNKPVIAPDIGAFTSLQQELGDQWIYCYQGDLSVADLKKGLATFSLQQRPATCPLENYEWHKIAVETHHFYQQLLPQSINNAAEQISL